MAVDPERVNSTLALGMKDPFSPAGRLASVHGCAAGTLCKDGSPGARCVKSCVQQHGAIRAPWSVPTYVACKLTEIRAPLVSLTGIGSFLWVVSW